MYQYRSVTGYHIVRVHGRDREIAHVSCADVAMYTGHVEGFSVRSSESVSEGEPAGVDPVVGGRVPEWVVGRGVEYGGMPPAGSRPDRKDCG